MILYIIVRYLNICEDFIYKICELNKQNKDKMYTIILVYLIVHSKVVFDSIKKLSESIPVGSSIEKFL